MGTKYSVSMGAYFSDANGKEKPIVMGSYGIGLERIMACAIEQKGDERGAVWPISIAPYDIYLVLLNPQEAQPIASEIVNTLTKNNFSIIIDDRDNSAGIKFNDADLIGIPIRLTIGSKGLKTGLFDIYLRETGETFEVKKEMIGETCIKLRETLLARMNE